MYEKIEWPFVFRRCYLKVPKREIFVTELFTLSDPIWVGDMQKNQFFKICRIIFAI
jgi:hypothetical protein